MLRRLGGCAVALALLLPAQALTAQAAPAPDQRAAATTKTRVVKLGHKPVRATTAHKVRLTFKGRKGQLVNLARVDAAQECGRRVLRSRSKVVKPWAPGYWRLPRTGTFTAINKPCARVDARIKVQVRKVVREDRLTDGAPVSAGRSRRVTHLVPFRIGRQQQAWLSGAPLDLIRPDRSITHDVVTERQSYLIRDYDGRERLDVASPRGTYFAAIPAGTTASLHARPLVHTSVDGPAVTITRGTAENASTQLVFSGEAGQWIYPELTSGTGDPSEVRWWTAQTLDAFGDFPARVGGQCPGGDESSFCPIVQLPASGTYVMNVLNAPGYGTAVRVRVRSAALAAPAVVDGDAVTYTVPTPGQWVVGELPELPRQESGGSGATVTLSNVTGPLGDWRVRTVSGYGRCNAWVGMGCFGIHEPPNAFTMSPTALTSPAPWDGFEHASVAILAVAPDATGSVDLRVTRPTS